jgi:dimethylaniline monooxygenase (N-oxide forming)
MLTLADRVYDYFWTQTPVGMAEFSDQPLPPIPEADQYHGFFPAKYVAQYLDSYIESHIYADRTLSSRIRTNSRITHLRKDPSDGQWYAQVREQNAESQRSYEVTAPRVIDATGLTSSPNIPSIPGLDTFAGEKVHQMYIARPDFLTDDKIRHVIVVGGAKSAADLAYAAAKAGKDVSWVFRKSGSGPASFAPAQGSGPYKNSNESFYTRLTALFIASHFVETSGSVASCFEWMLYRTSIGIAVFSWVWERITKRAWKGAGYATRQKIATQETSKDVEEPRGKGFHNLQPDTLLFWQNDSSGINQRNDFFSTIADKVAVYREDISYVTDKAVRLADEDETSLLADVITFATGWAVRNSYSHLDDPSASRLGLPILKSSQNQDEAARWAALDVRAEARILQRFPVLADPPAYYKDTSPLSPFRLYKGMLPISDHSIVFLGKIMLGNHFRAAEVQALWAVALFNGSLELPATKMMREDVAETVAWCRKRYLGKGQLGNWFWFDMVPYTDRLLEQLNLTSHRKSRGWLGFRDLLAPCFASDLRGLVDEYKNKHHRTVK